MTEEEIQKSIRDAGVPKIQAPPKAQELLSAVQEFDKKSDPLDLSLGGRLLDDLGAAEALRAGRKLSRLARLFAVAHEKEVATLRTLHLEAEEEVADYRDEAVDAQRLLKDIRQALDGGVLLIAQSRNREGLQIADRVYRVTVEPIWRGRGEQEAPDADA